MEFSNDGFRDSLTKSIAPNLFTALLERESALADREDRKISVGIIQCNGNPKALSYDLPTLNQILLVAVRGDEFYSRSISNGFWLFIRGNQKVAEIALERIRLRIEDAPIALSSSASLSYHAIERNSQRDLSDWLGRIDRQSFPGE
jgi:hypothetical protein